MKDLLDKLSSYNIFNYLFPGIIFVVHSKQWFGNFSRFGHLLDDNRLKLFGLSICVFQGNVLKLLN